MMITDIKIRNNKLERLVVELNGDDIANLIEEGEAYSRYEPNIVIEEDGDYPMTSPFHCSECGSKFGNGLESISYDGERWRHMHCAMEKLNG